MNLVLTTSLHLSQSKVWHVFAKIINYDLINIKLQYEIVNIKSFNGKSLNIKIFWKKLTHIVEIF